MAYLVTDNAATTLAASITNSPSVTTLTLTDASKFPIINHGGSGSDYTYVTLYDASGNIEVVKVTRRDNGSNNATILRGTAMGIANWTDATCRSWALTTTGVACRLIAQTVNDMSALANSSAASASAAASSASAAAASAAASIPLTQKAVASGVASLNADSKVVQTALQADNAANADNADMLDGYHAAAFAQLSGAAFTGNCSITSVAPTLTFVDTDQADFSVHVNTNLWYVLNQGGSGIFYIDQSGNTVANGNISAYSDERLKTNWRGLSDDFLLKLAKVKSGIYDRTDTEAPLTQVGVSAQSLQAVLPDAVTEDKDGLLTVSYGNAALAACVQLAREVVMLRAEIDKLKGK